MYKLIQSKITHHITYVNVLVLLNITFLMIFFLFSMCTVYVAVLRS